MDEQVGRYRIIKPLGEGAMAAVYLAELETGIGFKRKVALKVVRQEFAKDAKFVQLMGREAMIGSMLQHPNIVQTLEFNEADGRCFLALEFVEGETLETLLSRRRAQGQGGLPLVVALEAMVQVLKGLAYAHALTSHEGEDMGIVHRDLKPGNIMLSRHGLIKVMDFGIAKARIASANITTAGQVRGTPIYMAPEQVTGKDLDGRCDQFAAATVLYELLTGKQLFIANNLIRIMQSVARAEVEEQTDEVSELHPQIGPIMARMWQRATEDRYPTCDEPASLLEDIVFELKATARGGGAAAPSAPPQREAAHHEEEDSKGVLSALTLFVRKLFSSEKAPPAPPPKRKRKRKRKTGENATPRAAQPPPKDTADTPSEEPSFSSLDMVFEDSNTDERLAAVPPPPPPPPVTDEDEPVRRPAQLGPRSGPDPDEESTQPPSPPPTRKMASKPKEEGLDPFFYEDYD